MNEEMIALAQRLIDCPRFRWMPGMADTWGSRVREGDGIDRIKALPDLTDPATFGCLISLLQEVYNKKIVVSIGNGWWSMQTDYQDWDQNNTSSILEALTLAMESR